MSRKPTWQSPLFQLPLFLALGSAVACTPYPTVKDTAVDCSPESTYDLSAPISLVAGDGTANFWTSMDTTVATVKTSVQTLPNDALCGNTTAVEIQSSHNTDWGSLFGYNAFGGARGRDASMYEGMSFWARGPGNTTKAFTILLDDPNTDSPDADATGHPMDGGVGHCTKYGSNDGGGQNPGMVVVDQNGMPISGATTNAPPPDACGNGYFAVVTITTDWRFYTIPFTSFHQGATPNRVPNSALMQTGSVPGSTLITSALLNLVLRMPKEAEMDLWISRLGFYRKKALVAGADGGADAPRM
jgi:hypothetical protein